MRKAVKSCELTRPMGRPVCSMSVRVPRGEESRAPVGGHALPVTWLIGPMKRLFDGVLEPLAGCMAIGC